MATINYGNIRFNWKGDYNENTSYIKDDVVKHKGSSYVATQASTGIALDNENYWDKMVDGVENPDLVNQLIEEINSIKNKTDHFKVDDNNNLYVNNQKIPYIADILTIGEFRLFSFPANELPFGWYLRNGDRHASDSNIGKALKSLSKEFRRLWGIIEIDGYINLPNAFNSNGDGYFERAVDGVKRQAGSIQGDAIRNITGHVNTDNGWMFNSTSGAFFLSGKERDKLKASVAPSISSSSGWFDLDASRVVPTSHENRPINIGMTPAIYLGV